MNSYLIKVWCKSIVYFKYNLEIPRCINNHRLLLKIKHWLMLSSLIIGGNVLLLLDYKKYNALIIANLRFLNMTYHQWYIPLDINAVKEMEIAIIENNKKYEFIADL